MPLVDSTQVQQGVQTGIGIASSIWPVLQPYVPVISAGATAIVAAIWRYIEKCELIKQHQIEINAINTAMKNQNSLNKSQ